MGSTQVVTATLDEAVVRRDRGAIGRRTVLEELAMAGIGLTSLPLFSPFRWISPSDCDEARERARFEWIFGRAPSQAELDRFTHCRGLLAPGLRRSA